MRVNTNVWNRIRYTLIAPAYDRVASFRAQRRRSLDLLCLQPGERLLLSGVGTGSDLEFVPRGVAVAAVDITPAMVARTRARAAASGREIEASVGDAQALEFPSASFDAVVLHLIVAVAPDGALVIQEAARVVRPGGRIAIFDKFIADDAQPSASRRLINVVTNLLFSDVTRRLGPYLDGTDLRVVLREPAGLGGRFEIVILEKRTPPF